MNKLDFKSLTIGGLLSALIFVSLGAAEQGKHEAGTFVPYVIDEKGHTSRCMMNTKTGQVYLSVPSLVDPNRRWWSEWEHRIQK